MVRIRGILLNDNGTSVTLRTSGKGEQLKVTFPRSQIETMHKRPNQQFPDLVEVTVEIPDWLAVDRKVDHLGE